MKLKLLLIVILVTVFSFLITNKVLSDTEYYVQEVATTTPKIVPKSSVVKSLPTERQIYLINKYASFWGVSTTTLTNVISCESDFNDHALGDSGHSRGLAQIHDYYHPDITKDQAYNDEFAINFLAENISKGRGYLWSCYRILGYNR